MDGVLGNTLESSESDISAVVAQLKNLPNKYGYYVKDEPTIDDFSKINVINNFLKKFDSSALNFTCLLPSYGAYKWSDSAITYDEYVDAYIKYAKPQVLAMDYYLYTPSSTPNLNTYDLWKDLGYLRQKSSETGIPYWHVFQAVTNWETCGIENMTLEKYMVQMNAALAYGAKGVSYFTGTNAIVTENGEKSALYDSLSELNAKVSNIGNLLLDATSTEIYHPRLSSDESNGYNLSNVEESAYISNFNSLSSRNKNTICSVFEGADYDYIVITNKSVTDNANYNISLKNNVNVASFDAAANTIGDTTETNSISGTLAAGDIVVYVIAK